MKDFNGQITYRGKEYKLVFNLNVMEQIQEEYGTIDNWARLTDGKAGEPSTQEEDVTINEGAEPKDEKVGEPNAKAIIYGFTQMLNEGVDIENEEKGTDLKPFTLKQVGRMITEIGLAEATRQLNDTVIEATKSEEKNA